MKGRMRKTMEIIESHVLFKALNWALKTIKNRENCALNHKDTNYNKNVVGAVARREGIRNQCNLNLSCDLS